MTSRHITSTFAALAFGIALAASIARAGNQVRAGNQAIAGNQASADEKAAATRQTQWAEYQADLPKTIVELQPFRQSVSVEFEMPGEWGTATLVNLNPEVNAWYLLTLWWPGTAKPQSYHLENPLPKTQTLALAEDAPYGIRITADGRDSYCELWAGGKAAPLLQAQRSDLPYAPLCEDMLSHGLRFGQES